MTHGRRSPTILPNGEIPSESHTEVPDLDLIHVAVRRGPLKVLVVGGAEPVERILDAIRGALPPPVREYPQPAALHETSGQVGTVIVAEVADFTPTQQEQLMQWATRSPRATIVSLSSEPLWPAVVRGEFRADLFYRLNVITINLIDRSSSTI